MRIEAALLSHLVPVLQPLVGDRIFPLLLPQNPLPDSNAAAVTYSRVSTRNIRDMDGVAYKQVRLQYSCWSQNYGKAKAVAAEIGALEGFCGELNGIDVIDVAVANERDLYEGAARVYYTNIDLMIKFKGGE